MKQHSIEYLRELYSLEDGTCCITGPSWALRREKAPARARAVKPETGKPSSTKRAPGPRLRVAAGK